jgi:hypothetical protein
MQSAAFERSTELAEELTETCMHPSSGTPRTFTILVFPITRLYDQQRAA